MTFNKFLLFIVILALCTFSGSAKPKHSNKKRKNQQGGTYTGTKLGRDKPCTSGSQCLTGRCIGGKCS